ncbi:MAG: RNA 2'-phosphotransferase [Desulfobulbaceae bacterium]|nr:RNA 2'-phosphotransferase [Desulfobulbaceae bacterium]
MKKKNFNASKFLSYILRHKPEVIELSLDEAGWAVVDELIFKAQRHGYGLDRDLIERVVVDNDKQRFCLNGDHSKIRANQGHSVVVDLQLESQNPPSILFHGTAIRFLAGIMEQGLLAQERHHVHLSSNVAQAREVGRRHGKPVVLSVAARHMVAAGHLFYLSRNGVWLTEHVPSQYLTLG